jgi:hypothetical protein
MSVKVEKFLEFNGKKIIFLGKDGTYWIAIRPICEALGVQYVRNFKNIKEDAVLCQPLSVQTMVAADGKLRKMTCLPEFFVYGWLMGIQSDAPGLANYKWECYRVLFEHFHGAITGRKELIKQKAANSIMIDTLKNKVFATEEAQRLEKLERQQKVIDRNLRQLDHDQFDEELALFKQNIEENPNE